MSFLSKVLERDPTHFKNLIYLDGPVLATSKFLKWMGYDSSQLDVPNNSEDVYPMIEKTNRKDLCSVYSMSLSDYQKIAAKKDRTFVGIWADYCGQFRTHQNDIKDMFRLGLLESKSVYCATFNTRVNDPRENIKPRIEEFARENGYSAIEIESRNYGKSMFFIAFSTTKIGV